MAGTVHQKLTPMRGTLDDVFIHSGPLLSSDLTVLGQDGPKHCHEVPLLNVGCW